VIRTPVDQIRKSARDTMGVRLADLAKGVELYDIDRNVEDEGEEAAQQTADNPDATPDAKPDGK
jgi:DNA gyrase subunit A